MHVRIEENKWVEEGALYCILTFYLLFDTFCDIKPVLKKHNNNSHFKTQHLQQCRYIT